MNKGDITIIIAVIGAIMAIYNAITGRKKESKVSSQEILEKEIKVAERFTRIEKDIEYNKDAILKLSALMLHKPEIKYRRRDELVTKLNREGLNLDEVNEFIRLLNELKSRSDVEERDKLTAEFVLEQLNRKYRIREYKSEQA